MDIIKEMLNETKVEVLPNLIFNEIFLQTIDRTARMHKKHIIKVREYVKTHYPVRRTEVSQQCNLDAKELKDAEDTLRDAQGIMRIIRFRSVKSNGVKTRLQVIYCLYNVDKAKCKNCKYKEYCESELNA